MSTTTKRMEYAEALKIANRIAQELGPGVARIEVAGSVRRKQPHVGDIELLAIAQHREGMFPGQPLESLLDPVVKDLIDCGFLGKPIRDGSKWKTLPIEQLGLNLDLFIVQPWTWGVMMAIRTGPEDYSRRLVTQRCKGGLLHDTCRVYEGRVWKTTTTGEGPGVRCQMNVAPPGRDELLGWHLAQDTPEERDFFEFVQGGYIEPQRRRRKINSAVL